MLLLEEIHLRLLHMIESRPDLTQRELSSKLGVSLGEVNCCLAALAEKGE